MKIFLYYDGNLKRTVFWIKYLRDVSPELMQELVLINTSCSVDVNEWASAQKDFTYILFEEEVTCGSALNQVIKGLEIKDDVLISSCCYIPLVDSYERLLEVMDEKGDAFAVGPVSNTFGWDQSIRWKDATEALEWSEGNRNKQSEEVLMLESGVILFSRKAIYGEKTFDEEAKDLVNVVAEKCIREFMGHSRMYVCKNSGLWDIRGNEYGNISFPDMNLLEKRFNIHYMNVHGNLTLIKLLEECEDIADDIRVLEVGCDCGGTLFAIKKMFPDAELFGTDINDGALRFASEFAEVRVNNIENRNLDFDRNEFDVIIFGDVLEHLRDPLGTLLYCKKLLKKGGRIATSIPNLMNISVIRDLLDGNFTYSEIGLLDKTHIHMFTYNEIIRMFVNDAGYKIEKMTMNGSLDEDEDRLVNELTKLGKAEKFMYQAFQYQLVARLQ